MKMPFRKCARVGCKFPVHEESISCNQCGHIFHRVCSNLSPEEVQGLSSSWLCDSCLARRQSAPLLTHPRITLVTGNPDKARETLAILGSDYAPLFDHLVLDLPEHQGSPEEIIRLKSDFAAKHVHGPVLVEDTSLGFDALGGLPGPYIKWFLKAIGPEGLYRLLKGFGAENMGAKATTMFALSSDRNNPAYIFEGETVGSIVSPRGSSGFGWDPCFQPNGQPLTYAEMDGRMKNSLSHRYKAVAKLRDFLKNEGFLPAS